MCLSNGDVTLRNGHWAHTRNGVRHRDRNGGRHRDRNGGRHRDRNGPPLTRNGRSGPGRQAQPFAWLTADICAARTATFMNEARGYGPNC
jgi:hypothetical protein